VLSFRLLGPLEVADGGRSVAITSRRERALLAALLLRTGEVASTDRLLDDLWGERPPPAARASLQNAVSHLRAKLGADVLLTRSPGYVLSVEPEEVDLHRFQRLVTEAWERPPAERAAKLQEALALWRGPALADLAFEPFAELECARLDELRLAAEEDLLDARLALGADPGALIPRLEALVAEHPLREGLRGQLMLALYRAGRQADALEAYRAGRDTLLDELGLEPGPALKALEGAILRQDPSLQPAAPDDGGEAIEPEHRRTATVAAFELVVNGGGDPEALERATRPALAAIRDAVERHGGTVTEPVGDELVAFFGLPVVHEDDALRALRAVEAARALDEADVGVACAVASGTVLVRGGSPRASGEVVALARRLAYAAEPGEVLVGPETLRLVRHAALADPAEPVRVRGHDEPIPVARLRGLAPDAETVPRRLDAPLAGRAGEVRTLQDAFARARDEARCVTALVVGEPGIGKSRLARELVRTVGDEATLLVGRCVSYGEGATFLPLRDVLAQAAGEPTEDALRTLLAGRDDANELARRLAELVGTAEGAGSTADGFRAVRLLLEALAAERPVLLALDDCHWAEPTFLDLVDHVAAHAQAPLLVLCLGRPEVLEARPAWEAWEPLRLEPLAADEARSLVAEAGAALPDAARERIVELAGGNPLFAEQLAAYTAEEGATALDSVPGSIEALLASRIDRLTPPERAVLEHAAVLGRDFQLDALAHLLESSPPVDALDHLAARGLVRPARSTAGACRFHHVLVRDVAYDSLPKTRRGELHERAADWLEGRDAPDEVVGFHLERAHALRTELDPGDGHARRLAQDAGERLGRAGLRAFMRGDVAAAVNLLRRAVALLPQRDARRRELLCELGIALNAAADPAAAIDALEEAARTSHAEGDRRLEARARIERAGLRMYAHEGRPADVLALVELAVPLFEALDDQRSLARAWLWKGLVHGGFFCQNAAWEDAAERALLHYSRTLWSTATCRGQLAAALFFGPRPVPEALERCAQLLREAGGERVAEAEILGMTGALQALAGRFDEARSLLESSRTSFRELGRTLAVTTGCAPASARIEMLAEDYGAAESHLREACETLDRLHMWAYLATHAADLARALVAQGRLEEADRWSALAQRHATEGDISAQFSWRSARALVLARHGDPSGAEIFAREAVEILAATDALNQHAQAVLDLAEVLRIAGRLDEARQAADEAAKLFERKENVVSARVARGFAAEVQAG
jgi:DNA-binding SARP family transcriptional activator/predicted ATPase